MTVCIASRWKFDSHRWVWYVINHAIVLTMFISIDLSYHRYIRDGRQSGLQPREMGFGDWISPHREHHPGYDVTVMLTAVHSFRVLGLCRMVLQRTRVRERNPRLSGRSRSSSGIRILYHKTPNEYVLQRDYNRDQ